jgi:spore maturation protein CgeB
MGHQVELFDYMSQIQKVGRQKMNANLLDMVRGWKPDICIFSLYTDQFDLAAIKELKNLTKTFCFFHDDTWRVDYSRYWARQFDFFSSPDFHGVAKYSELGLKNCIYFPFGCNEKLFRKLDIPKQYDISFVGGWHSYREWIIGKIRRAGLAVEVAGYGWPAGEVNQSRMIEIFNQTRINLNLSNSVSWDIRYLASSPRALVHRIRSKKSIEQMKARIFEINGCGGFQLTYYVDGLANCYAINEEIATYSDPDDLIEKINYYLTHKDLRKIISEAGYQRTLKDHTIASNFEKVFSRMSLSNA